MSTQKVERPDIRINDANWMRAQKYIGGQLMKRGIDTAILPGGIAIDARAWRGFKHSVNVKTYVLNEPQNLIKDPDPRCRYVWRPRNDPAHSTEGLVNTGHLSPVDYARLDQKAAGAEFTYAYAGAGDDDEMTGFVACGGFGLFEVKPETAYRWFEEPVDSTFARIAGLKPMLQEDAEADGRMKGYKVRDTSITVADAQDVPTEQRNPITHG